MKIHFRVRTDLKKAIIDWMIENENVWQPVNSTIEHFRQYIYDDKGEYII